MVGTLQTCLMGMFSVRKLREKWVPVPKWEAQAMYCFLGRCHASCRSRHKAEFTEPRLTKAEEQGLVKFGRPLLQVISLDGKSSEMIPPVLKSHISGPASLR